MIPSSWCASSVVGPGCASSSPFAAQFLAHCFSHRCMCQVSNSTNTNSSNVRSAASSHSHHQKALPMAASRAARRAAASSGDLLFAASTCDLIFSARVRRPITIDAIDAIDARATAQHSCGRCPRGRGCQRCRSARGSFSFVARRLGTGDASPATSPDATRALRTPRRGRYLRAVRQRARRSGRACSPAKHPACDPHEGGRSTWRRGAGTGSRPRDFLVHRARTACRTLRRRR